MSEMSFAKSRTITQNIIGRITLDPFLMAIMAPRWDPTMLKAVAARARFQITIPESAYVKTDVIDAIQNDRQPLVTAYDGKKALEMVLAIYKSAAEGRPVQFPLTECSTLDFTGRF